MYQLFISQYEQFQKLYISNKMQHFTLKVSVLCIRISKHLNEGLIPVVEKEFHMYVRMCFLLMNAYPCELLMMFCINNNGMYIRCLIYCTYCSKPTLHSLAIFVHSFVLLLMSQVHLVFYNRSCNGYMHAVFAFMQTKTTLVSNLLLFKFLLLVLIFLLTHSRF